MEEKLLEFQERLKTNNLTIEDFETCFEAEIITLELFEHIWSIKCMLIGFEEPLQVDLTVKVVMEEYYEEDLEISDIGW